ncbi:MAG: GNAT family N-acetyltransferase [Saprospiraceae bacterium]
MEIRIAGPDDIDLLLPALLELRPHRSAEEMRIMLLHQFGEGFQIIFIGDDNFAYALAGFRTIHFLFSGKTLYIDDLVTHSDHKRKGYAGALLDWLKQHALQNGYDHISLDSGFHRKDAYRLYLNKGFEISSMHFSKKLSH